MQSNEYNLRTLHLPIEKEHFSVELQEDLFEQLYSLQTGRNKPAHLDQQVFAPNHFRYDTSRPEFTFNLLFLQRIVFSTNEENFGKLILGLLNVLSIWFDLGILDLHPIFILSHDYLLVQLYLHLPVYLFNKFTQVLTFCDKWLKKFEAPLYERLKRRKRKIPRKPRRF